MNKAKILIIENDAPITDLLLYGPRDALLPSSEPDTNFKKWVVKHDT
ncbi:hypothetical protein [Paenibacillus sp. JJ1683]